jgi:alkylation response protein AidB-like acyl-CoA dehydrogenase
MSRIHKNIEIKAPVNKVYSCIEDPKTYPEWVRTGKKRALDYAKERLAFGEPIASRQAIAFMLAEMAIEIESTRLMTWEAAWKLDRKEEATKEASLVKAYADDMVLMVTDRAVQILGGHGYVREHPAELWLRNGRGFTTFDGMAIV